MRKKLLRESLFGNLVRRQFSLLDFARQFLSGSDNFRPPSIIERDRQMKTRIILGQLDRMINKRNQVCIQVMIVTNKTNADIVLIDFGKI